MPTIMEIIEMTMTYLDDCHVGVMRDGQTLYIDDVQLRHNTIPPFDDMIRSNIIIGDTRHTGFLRLDIGFGMSMELDHMLEELGYESSSSSSDEYRIGSVFKFLDEPNIFVLTKTARRGYMLVNILNGLPMFGVTFSTTYDIVHGIRKRDIESQINGVKFISESFEDYINKKRKGKKDV